MQYFVTGFLLLAGFFFWGAGLAVLITPRMYRRYALIFALPMGLSLQSLVVWIGAHTALCGTDFYGRASLIIPFFLLVLAIWRNRQTRIFRWTWFWPVGLLMIVQLSVMLTPLAIGSRELATVSIGSLDAADYAAGARVLQEFSSYERTGFFGQTSVVSVGAVDNFFDYWVRTNHFTPSALIALNGSILGLKPFELTSILTIVLLTATLPMVFWLLRSGLGFRSWSSWVVTAIFAFSPINWHAVYNVAPAQILAANTIALLTWCGLALWRRHHQSKTSWSMAGLLALGYGLLLGSYNFMVVACLVPVIAVTGGATLWSWCWARFTRWLVVMLLPLGLAGVVYWERSAGIIERFILFREIAFGWYIPPLGPEGWLGITEGTWLKSYTGWFGGVLMVISVLLILWGLVKASRRFPSRAFTACALTIPIMVGYGMLAARSVFVNSIASYDAYKLFSVFYPGMLAGFCLWIDVLARSAVRPWRMMGWSGAIIVLTFNIGGEWRYLLRFTNPGLIADTKLAKLTEIERLRHLHSINIRLTDDWERLWANGFLLRKQQFFDRPTYEGRRPTGPNGQWDLVGTFFRFDLPVAADCLHPVEGYTLLNRASASFVEAGFVQGWADVIRGDPNAVPRTRWATAEVASVILQNPHQTPLSIRLRSTLRAFGARECEIKIGEQVIGRLAISPKPQDWTCAQVNLPPGNSLITFTTFTPADLVGGRLKRPVTMALDGLDIEVLADSATLGP